MSNIPNDQKSIEPQSAESEDKKLKFKLGDFLLSFLLPTLFGKSLVIYFGLEYSENPGEGYGYGLALAILFTLSMIGRFLWKYRGIQDA